MRDALVGAAQWRPPRVYPRARPGPVSTAAEAYTPGDLGMAFVVVSHLDPDHAPILHELMGKSTTMPVLQVTDGVPIQPNHVYVKPPAQDLAILNGTLHLMEPKQPHGARLKELEPEFMDTVPRSELMQKIFILLRARAGQAENGAGQDALKRKARIAIGAALQRGEPLPHCLLTSSGGGLGKSTLAQILANEVFQPLISTTGQCLGTAYSLRNVLVRLQPNSLLLVDEFHAVGRLAADELLLVLEQGCLNVNLGRDGVPVRLPLPPFTLIAATTKPESIADPLRQRFGLNFHFDFYGVEDLKQIVAGMAKSLGITLDEAVCAGIARRALGVPRIALRLAERVRDVAQARRLTTATAAEYSRW